MRLVLDTNILVSALINPHGNPRNLFDRWVNGEFELVTSEFQLDELTRVLTYPRVQKYLRGDEPNALVARLRNAATIATDLPEIHVSPDPDDNFIIASAIATNSHAIVTGDKKDLLSLKSVQGVKIVSVTACVEQFNERRS